MLQSMDLNCSWCASVDPLFEAHAVLSEGLSRAFKRFSHLCNQLRLFGAKIAFSEEFEFATKTVKVSETKERATTFLKNVRCDREPSGHGHGQDFRVQ